MTGIMGINTIVRAGNETFGSEHDIVYIQRLKYIINHCYFNLKN